jgi:hypothetical protein
MADKTIEVLLKLNDQMSQSLPATTKAMNDLARATDKLAEELNKEEKAQKKSEDATRQNNREHEKQKSVLGNVGTQMAASIAGWMGGVFAISTLTNVLKSSVQAYDEEIQAEKELERALGFSSKALLSQASALQQTTRYADDATKRAMAHLAVYTKEEDTIKMLMPLIQDFATAKQMDLVSATEVVSKSIFGEVNMLGRYGISLGGAKTESDKLANATKALSTMFKGAAETAGNEGAGGLVKFKNAVGDLSETIGKTILPTIDFWTEKMSALVNQWNEFMGQGTADLNEQSVAAQRLSESEMKLAGTIATMSRLEKQRNTFYKDSQGVLDDRLAKLAEERAALEQNVETYKRQVSGLAKLAKQESEIAARKKADKPARVQTEEERKATEDAVNAANKSYEDLMFERSLIGLSEQELEIANREKHWNNLIAIDKAGGARHLKELEQMKQYELAVLRSGLPSSTALDISGIYSPSAGTSYTLGQNTGGDAAMTGQAEGLKRAQAEAAKRELEAKALAENVRVGGLDPLAREEEEFKKKRDLLKEHQLSVVELERQHQEAIAAIALEAQQKRLEVFAHFAGGVSALLLSLNAKDKTMRIAGKTAAITQVGIDTYAAAQKAIAIYGPTPPGYAAAAGAIAYGAANANNIRKQKYEAGTKSPYASFGVVPGTSYTGDKVPVFVNSGEKIMSRQEVAQEAKTSKQAIIVTYAPVYNVPIEPWREAQNQLNFARTLRSLDVDPSSKRIQARV